MQIFQVVVIGILLVFIILLILTLILMLFPKIVNKKRKEESKENLSVVTSAENDINPAHIDDYTLISVISAAIAAYRGTTGENANTNSFRVVTFHKVKKDKI